MKIVGYHIANSLIANSDGEIHTQSPWLDFLFADKDRCIKVLYHLDYSVACLLKMIKMPEDACRELLTTTDLEYMSYNFQYIPGRWFAIKDRSTGQWAGFSDMSQYNNCRLDTKQTVVQYAIEARTTGERIYSALAELGLHPKSLTSPISVYNKEILSNMDLPTIDDMPDEVAELAYQCCKGPWIECFKLGHFENAYDFDIRSAYGSELSGLIDFRDGRWIQSKDYVPDAIYGYCKGTVFIDSNFSPIIYKNGESSFTPTGVWQTVLTKNEIDFINRWKLGNFDIEDSWWWIPDSNQKSLPLKNIIADLYIRKLQADDNFEDYIIKRIISGIWGKLLETTEKDFGELFNPVWAAEVETNTRLKCAEFVLVNNLQNNVLSITVDGVLIATTDRHNDLLPKVAEDTCQSSAAANNRTMGTWKLSAHCPSIIVSSGVQAVKDKVHNSTFAVTYNWLIEQIRTKPQAREYRISGTSPVTLAKAITQSRFSELGKLEKIDRIIDLTCETKRCYRNIPRNGRELLNKQYDSVPWDISIVKGDSNENNGSNTCL